MNVYSVFGRTSNYGNIARYITTGLISFAVSIIMLGISAMFATEYWKPLGNIFISIFGQ